MSNERELKETGVEPSHSSTSREAGWSEKGKNGARDVPNEFDRRRSEDDSDHGKKHGKKDKKKKKKGKKWWERSEQWTTFTEEDKIKYYGKPEERRPKDQTELEIFQNLVGIHFLREGGGVLHPKHRKALGLEKPVSAFNDIFFASKTADLRFRNRGLYNRCLAQDQKNRVMYSLSNYVISFLYLLQILIAAAITGLSAYERNASVPLTVLGAINAVLAGILAWLNGQGMPIRFRRARDQYRECVKAIENAERTFAEIDYHTWPGDSRPDPFKVRDELEKMYEDARADQESNYPDTQEGPSKNQMENQKKVLETQIAEHKTEKDNAAEKLKKERKEQDDKMKEMQKAHEEAIAVRDGREEAIRTDFDKIREKVAERAQQRSEAEIGLQDAQETIQKYGAELEEMRELLRKARSSAGESVQKGIDEHLNKQEIVHEFMSLPTDEKDEPQEQVVRMPMSTPSTRRINVPMSMPTSSRSAAASSDEPEESALAKFNRLRQRQRELEEQKNEERKQREKEEEGRKRKESEGQ